MIGEVQCPKQGCRRQVWGLVSGRGNCKGKQRDKKYSKNSIYIMNLKRKPVTVRKC